MNNSNNALENSQRKFCIYCGESVPVAARFCSQCGKGLQDGSTALRPSAFLKIVGLSLITFCTAWGMKSALGGTAPSEQFQPQTAKLSSQDDSELSSLRSSAESNPTDVKGWIALANGLAERLREHEKPSPEMVFETIDVLRKILDIDQKNPFALIAMADISFEQQAFSKAAEFYVKYLNANPKDLNARARYASTLAFLNQHDQALKELETVLKDDPNNFNAKAYMAITYAQLGDRGKAKERGAEALRLAPNDEARARFSDFLEKLTDQPPARGTDQESHVIQPELPAHAQAIVAKARENPVAGPKFVEGKMEGTSTVLLFFSQFPMSQMPPFIKERFLAGFKTLPVTPSERVITSVLFIDKESGERMEELSLKTE